MYAFERSASEQHKAILVPFTAKDPRRAIFKIDVIDVKVSHLADAQARIKHHGDNN